MPGAGDREILAPEIGTFLGNVLLTLPTATTKKTVDWGNILQYMQ